MTASAGNNFIGAMGTIAGSNLQLAKFDKAAEVIKSAGNEKDKEAAAKKFEAMFVSQLLNLMFNTVKVDENFGGGFAEETYRGLMVDEYGNAISKTGGIGIANDLQKTLFDFQNIDNQAKSVVSGANAYSKYYNV